MEFQPSHLHEALGTSGQLARGTEVRFVTVHIRIDHALVEPSHRKAIKDDLKEKQEYIMSTFLYFYGSAF